MRKVFCLLFIFGPALSLYGQKFQLYNGMNKVDSVKFYMEVEEVIKTSDVTHVRLCMSGMNNIEALVEAFQYRDSTVTYLDGIRSGITFPISRFYNLKLGIKERVNYMVGTQQVNHIFEKLSEKNGITIIRDTFTIYDSLKLTATMISIIKFKGDYNFPESTEVIKLNGCNEILFNTTLTKK